MYVELFSIELELEAGEGVGIVHVLGFTLETKLVSS